MRRATALVLLVVAGCAGEPRSVARPGVSTSIGRAVMERPADPVVMADMADFPWDRVYIFGPYTPAATIQDSVGPGCCGGAERRIAMSDDHDLLVFVDDGADPVVESHPRHRGDFAPSVLGRGIPRDQAVFRVEGSPTDGWPVLHPAGVPGRTATGNRAVVVRVFRGEDHTVSGTDALPEYMAAWMVEQTRRE